MTRPTVATHGHRALPAAPPRCAWAKAKNPVYLAYHDHEWGVPCHDETRLFELLNLEGAQAGLSWETVLMKRAHYRHAFDQWNATTIASYDAGKVARLLADAGIIRHRQKVAATIQNARAYLELCEVAGGLDPYLWGFVDGTPIVNRRGRTGTMPTRTPLSDRISKDLSARGFKFVGSTIIYAYLQATGVVNDHVLTCFCHPLNQPRAG